MKRLLLVIVIALLGFCGWVSMQPEDFRVSRSARLDASPERVFPHLSDLRKWNDWSPWAKLDPNATIEISEPSSGINAWMTWAGNSEIGEGTMTITESAANERVAYRLDFRAPFESTSDAVFSLRPEGTGTNVTWTMSGKNGFIGKLFSVLIDCDKMIGGQFEIGLANLAKISTVTPASLT